MLKESYLANMRNLPKDSVKIVVTRSAGHILSPSWDLLNDYKHGKINWDQYVARFRQEMSDDTCMVAMRKIRDIAKLRDVYLICYEKKYPCHRYILKKMIEELAD